MTYNELVCMNPYLPITVCMNTYIEHQISHCERY